MFQQVLYLLDSPFNMDRAGDLLSVHQFIKILKEEQNGKLTKYMCFSELTSKQLEIDLSKTGIPISETSIHKFIHGDIFEYAVQQAAGYTSNKDDPWRKFRELYPNIKQKKKKQYNDFMDAAGRAAWEIFDKNLNRVYGRKNKSIRYSFGYHIHNNTFPILTRKLEADIFVSSMPNIVCDIKYSTMKKATYEQEYLVHAIIQVLIYSLALHLDPCTLQLRVLVFFSKTAEAVLYESDIHKDKTLVNQLFKKLNGKPVTKGAEEFNVRKGKNLKESEKGFTVAKRRKLNEPEKRFTVKKGRNLTELEEEFTDDDNIIQSLNVVNHG